MSRDVRVGRFGPAPASLARHGPERKKVKKRKNRRQLASDAGHLGFGIVAPGFSEEKTEVGSIRRRPVGGGLGVYEPVPDRTVSGNAGKFVGHWGMSADKKRQKCVEASPIQTGVSQT
ncbi:MAG: hypothetical protein EOS78_16275 [Mesorhizobium sp.]|nr:MAG: hypothetical protein EOS78_16275 [Mesorhizobium sp.]